MIAVNLIRRTSVIFTVLAAFLGSGYAQAADPVVSNVRSGQRTGTKLVDIKYDLTDADGGSLSVTVAVSTNDGATYNLPASSFSDGGSAKSIGNGVSPGNNRWIVWNAAADWNGQFSSLVKFSITASDGTAPTGMVLIPAGSFVMGATTNVGHESKSEERPQHTVYVSAFYMDRYEVTKILWDEVATWASVNGYDIYSGSASGKAPNHPAHSVSWYEAVKWCNARAQKDGLTPCYTANGLIFKTQQNTNVVCNWLANGYRLPTEAEWEKAARGGVANRRFPWSDSDEIQHARANYFSKTTYAYDTSPTRGNHPSYTNAPQPYTSPAGSFAANGYGLYDMAGNAWEWCWDWYSTSYYSTSPVTDPRGASSGSSRVLRGGGWNDSADNTRVAYRYLSRYYYPAREDYSLGFRCARGL